jgi:hypothetical protein
MGDNILSSGVAILTAIVGLAILAVILSKRSSTVSVITAGGSAFSSLIGKAVSPISS